MLSQIICFKNLHKTQKALQVKLLRWLLAVLFDAATRRRECAGKKNRSGTSEDKKASKVISCTIKKKRTARRRNGRGQRLHDFTTINATSIFRAVGAVGAGGTASPQFWAEKLTLFQLGPLSI